MPGATVIRLCQCLECQRSLRSDCLIGYRRTVIGFSGESLIDLGGIRSCTAEVAESHRNARVLALFAVCLQ